MSVWCFCKICEMYHVCWETNGLDARYETHLSPEERIEAMSFPFYKKEINSIHGVYLILCHPEYLKDTMKLYPKGIFDPNSNHPAQI